MKFETITNNLTGIYASRKNHPALKRWSPEVIERFRIGVSLKDDVVNFLINENIPFHYGEHLWLVKRDAHNFPYDSLENQIIFPHFNLNGDVIQFTGWSLHSSYEQSLVQSKRPFGEQLLPFGYYQQEDEIKKTRKVILVESLSKVLDLKSQGVSNVLGVDGPILSDLGMRVLKESADTIEINPTAWNRQVIQVLLFALKNHGFDFIINNNL